MVYTKNHKSCPKCKQQGSGPFLRWVKNEQGKIFHNYQYFAHKIKQNGIWKTKWCYIGKKESGS